MWINRSCAVTILVATFGAFSLSAQPTALSSSLANQVDYLTFTSNSYPTSNLIGAYGGGYGGAFRPQINAGSTQDLVNSQFATVFCVDYQLDVTSGSRYPAQVTTLDSIATGANTNVRYGDINSVGAGGWVNSLGNATTISAAYRYTLAADLVAQYGQGGVPDNTTTNQSIQEAIWYITANNEYTSIPGASDAAFSPANALPGTDYMTWVNTAQHDIAQAAIAGTLGTLRSSWAVISGPSPLGVPTVQNGYPGYQTFLVKLSQPTFDLHTPTPEPGFYGLVAAGLGGLLYIRRRKKA